MLAPSTYCASKWAVEGLTEGINKEVHPDWNSTLPCIEPGGFRTEWAHQNRELPNPPPRRFLGGEVFGAMEAKLKDYGET